MLNEKLHQELQAKCIVIINKNSDVRRKLKEVVELLHKEVPHYNWVGFYLGDNEKQELSLGPFAGAATEHTRIPYGKGICGQVAVSHTTMNIENVMAEENYLACSTETKSELVVPIMKDGVFVGQLDIDSHSHDAFNVRDERLIQGICRRLAECF